VKKKLLLIAAAPLVVWAVSGVMKSFSSVDATVTIQADHPSQLRSVIMTRVESFGGKRVDEHTDFSAQSSSDLRFVIPTARLEEVLAALETVGGRVISQDVTYADASTAASSVATGVDSAQSCLTEALSAVQSGGSGATSAVSDCQKNLRVVSDRLTTVEPNVAETNLEVNVVAAGGFQWATLVVILILVLIVLAIAILIYRFFEGEDEIDVSDDADEDATSPSGRDDTAITVIDQGTN